MHTCRLEAPESFSRALSEGRRGPDLLHKSLIVIHKQLYHLPQKSVLNEVESATSAPPSTFPGENWVDFVAKLNMLKFNY